VLTDMLAVRFGADQAHFAKPLKMRPSSDSCAEPYSLSWVQTWISQFASFGPFHRLTYCWMWSAGNFQRRAHGPENLRQSAGEGHRLRGDSGLFWGQRKAAREELT